jgi:drug/metabolite transporter (DMT)-like permease
LKPLLDRPRLLLIVTALSWSGNVIAGRVVIGIVPPLMFSCLRWTLATLLLLPVAWSYLRKEWPEIVKNRGLLLFLGFIGPACYNSFYYFALVSTDALNGLILSAAGPMIIALTAWSIFGDRPEAPQLAGMATGFFGVLLIIARGDVSSLAALKFNPGDLLVLAALVAWAVYTAYLRLRPAISWQSYNFVTYAIAAAANIPLVAVEAQLGYTTAFNWTAVAAIAFVAIFPSVIGYIFYNRAVEMLGPAAAGIYLFLIPVFGAILATVLLGENLQLFHALGFALIIAGVLIGSRKAAPGRVPAASSRD